MRSKCKSSIIPFLVPCHKVWLTPTAPVPCNNAVETGELKGGHNKQMRGRASWVLFSGLMDIKYTCAWLVLLCPLGEVSIMSHTVVTHSSAEQLSAIAFLSHARIDWVNHRTEDFLVLWFVKFLWVILTGSTNTCDIGKLGDLRPLSITLYLRNSTREGPIK